MFKPADWATLNARIYLECLPDSWQVLNSGHYHNVNLAKFSGSDGVCCLQAEILHACCNASDKWCGGGSLRTRLGCILPWRSSQPSQKGGEAIVWQGIWLTLNYKKQRVQEPLALASFSSSSPRGRRRNEAGNKATFAQLEPHNRGKWSQTILRKSFSPLWFWVLCM